MAKSFAEATELDSDTLMVVDALNTAFRFKHSGQLDFMEDYVRMVKSLQKSYKAGKVILASDIGSSSYRKEVYPEYKENRKEKFAEQTPEEAYAFELFFKEFRATLEGIQETTDFPVIQFNKVEADDIAAYIVKYAEKYGIKRVVLISTDKDWDLLIKSNVMRFSYVTRKETTWENWNDHYECGQEEYISVKCLQGDAGDNVPGIDKVGPKTAIKLIQQYGSALDIADAIPLPGKYVYIKNLNAFGAEALRRNYQLMDLLTFCEDAIGVENCKIIDKILEDYLG